MLLRIATPGRLGARAPVLLRRLQPDYRYILGSIDLEGWPSGLRQRS
jgi:hypothetical protein